MKGSDKFRVVEWKINKLLDEHFSIVKSLTISFANKFHELLCCGEGSEEINYYSQQTKPESSRGDASIALYGKERSFIRDKNADSPSGGEVQFTKKEYEEWKKKH